MRATAYDSWDDPLRTNHPTKTIPKITVSMQFQPSPKSKLFVAMGLPHESIDSIQLDPQYSRLHRITP